ncbi:MAG TPA: hypothetical protein PLR99_16740 [Polyangiaceae bacterium]|nr:hypothetical protein [Polyangiaceae bacterium]
MGHSTLRLRRLSLGALALPLLLAACTPPRAPAASPTPGPAPTAPALAGPEERFLQRLAALDPRLARRLGRSPTSDELVELAARVGAGGAREGGVVGATLDLFAFDARARELTRALEELEARARVVAPGERDELALVRALYAAEATRARRERDLTVSGGELLVAATQVATDATGDDAVGASDAWLAERLGDVLEAVTTRRPSVAHRRELADALDPVERALSGARLPRAFAALAGLREAVGEAKMMGETKPLPDVAAEATLDDVRALVGERLANPDLLAALASAEGVLAREANAALAKLSDRDADRARAAAGARLALRAPCKNARAASVMRSLPAPREREAGCLAVRALAEARPDVGSEAAEAWVLLHDRVAIGLWSAAFHTERVTLDAARGRARLLGLPEDATKSALLRAAAVRPGEAIGAGLMAALVVDGPRASVERARAVVAFGDAGTATLRAHLTEPALPPAAPGRAAR